MQPDDFAFRIRYAQMKEDESARVHVLATNPHTLVSTLTQMFPDYNPRAERGDQKREGRPYELNDFLTEAVAVLTKEQIKHLKNRWGITNVYFAHEPLEL